MKKDGDKQQSEELSLVNFVPRGSILKHSDDVYALVLFTGPETKLVLNQGKYKFKNSHITNQLNLAMFINCVTMVFFAILMSQILGRSWNINQAPKHYYIFPEEEIPVGEYQFNTFFSFILIYNGLVPMDFLVSLGLAKLFYLLWLGWDIHMIDPERSEESGELKRCRIRNSELLQDCSLVNHMFCDKTGTLT